MEPSDARPSSVSDAWLLGAASAPVAIVVAHVEDLLAAVGIVRALGPARVRAVVWTAAPQAALEAARAALDLERDALVALDVAPEDILGRVAAVAGSRASRESSFVFFDREAARIEAIVRPLAPDRVFTSALEGVHVEHDVVHAIVTRAVRRERNRRAAAVPLVELPSVEPGLHAPLRFAPWTHGDRRALALDAHALEAKRAWWATLPEATRGTVARAARVLASTRALAPAASWLGGVLEGPLARPLHVLGALAEAPLARVLATEHVRVVDPERPPREAPATWPLAGYAAGPGPTRRLAFDQHVRPVVEAVLG
jgi:hypothetical protein